MADTQRRKLGWPWQQRRRTACHPEKATVDEKDASPQITTVVFLCIQTRSETKWGLLPKMLQCLQRQGIEVIDHRTWHPTKNATTDDHVVFNEIFCRDQVHGGTERNPNTTKKAVVDARIHTIRESIVETIRQPHGPHNYKVRVQRWYPDAMESKEDDSNEHSAQNEKQEEETTVQDLTNTESQGETTMQEVSPPLPVRQRRPRRQKVRSVPVGGGSLFGEETALDLANRANRHAGKLVLKEGDEEFDVCLSHGALHALRSGDTAATVSDQQRPVEITPSLDPTRHLQGLVRGSSATTN